MVRPYPTSQKQLFRKGKKCVELFGVEKLVWLAQNFVLNPIDYLWGVLIEMICQVFMANISVWPHHCFQNDRLQVLIETLKYKSPHWDNG